LHQSHSGWLDLALGIGIPGVCLILFALVFNVFFLGKLNIENRSGNQYQHFGGVFFWILVANLLMWCTTEISQKVFFECLIFMLSITSGFLMGSDNKFATKP
jgi:O-antigen ligase